MWNDRNLDIVIRFQYQVARTLLLIRRKYSSVYKISYLLFIIPLFLISCNSNSTKTTEDVKYTCAMHPEIVKNEPGACPICGMDLTKMRTKTAINLQVDSSLDKELHLNKESFTNDLETISLQKSTQTPFINLNGTITYNSNQIKTISARVSGRVEKSYVKYNFEPVKKGQLLLKVYSAELSAIQQELLYLKSKNETALLNQTKTKLLLLGVSNNQINQILKSGKANYTINVYSNYSGYILNSNTANLDGLQTANTALNITEGTYINAGDIMFKVFNDNELWLNLYANTSESGWIKNGAKIELTINKKTIESRVNLVQPFYKDNQSLTLIRVVLANKNHLYKIGQLATATISQNSIIGIWVPQEAVYQLGEKNIVFIKQNQALKAIEINVEAKANNQFLIKGLKEGDEIAKNASYMIDSESFIKTNNND